MLLQINSGPTCMRMYIGYMKLGRDLDYEHM